MPAMVPKTAIPCQNIVDVRTTTTTTTTSYTMSRSIRFSKPTAVFFFFGLLCGCSSVLCTDATHKPAK